MTELRQPAGGWTLAEAAAALLPEPYAAAAQPPPKDWWMAGGAEAHKQERDAFRLAFSRLMGGGDYVADGVAEGDAGPSLIPPPVWRAAEFQLGFPGEPRLAAEVVAGRQRWRGVRVMVAPAAISPPEPAVITESLPARANAGQAYSDEALAAWFYLRVKTWLKGERTPSEAECIAAAEDYFADPPGRDVIRAIRQKKTPENWRKRGPKPRR